MLKIAWRENFAHHLPAGHRFPMAKYDLLREQLLYEGTVQESNFFRPEPISEEAILSVHEHAYWTRLRDGLLSPAEIRRSGFPHNPALIERERCIMQGTVEAAVYALKHGVAFNSAGGTHHAFTNRAEGFCLLNDIALGAQHLLDQKLAEKILVIDLDVHQGNGSAQIFQDEPRVFTLSIHGAKNFPMHKEKSDLDVPLEDGTEDQTYHEALTKALDQFPERYQADFVFYQAGVDVLETDKLGRMALTREGCAARDRMVFEWCQQHHLPICVSMGGGYSKQLKDIVEAHANTYRLAQELYF